MACYKLTSCTAGNITVIYSTSNLAAYVGGPAVGIVAAPGICYTVELSDPPCQCINPVNVVVDVPDCSCDSPFICYKLTECNNQIPPFYTSTNLAPYIGGTVSVFEQSGLCFLVAGVTDFQECDAGMPTVVTCAAPCVCGPPLNCYTLTNCLAAPPFILTINTTLTLTVGNVVSITPILIPPGGNNCWIVNQPVTPCTAGTGTTVTAVVDFGPQPNGCTFCAGPPTCYKLTDCQDPLNIYYSTEPALAGFVGLFAGSASFPGHCFLVSINVGPCVVVIPFISPALCVCPCFTLTNCRTGATLNTNSNLAAYVGLSVHIDPPNDLGCNGDCWSVAATVAPARCDFPVIVVVSTCQNSCGPCGETCYELVDCETDVVFLTALNPTFNGVNLGSLISGQAIGQVNVNGVITNGCWYVRLAQDCASAVVISVFNIYQPTPTQTGCEQCLNSCYGLLNCKTLVIDYIIKYTSPNPNGLPNPNTLTGVIGSLCFDPPTGCVSGCYQLQLIPGVSCVGSVDWTTVVSMTPYQDCFDCSPPCYLLTECAPAISTPIVVNNDLSLYVGNIAKICDSQGVCHCYSVELAQSCDNAITIDNANASFITCEDCNSCDCPPGYTKIGNNCQKITTVPATANPTIYSTGPGSINALYGNLGTRFYNNISALPFPLSAVVGPDRMVDAALVTVPQVTNTTGVWGGPAGSRLNTIGIWTTVPPNPILQWIGFAECIDIPVSGTYCIGIAGDDQIRMKIDGVLAATIGIGLFDFNYWHVFEITLTAGTHVITLEGNNNGGPAAFAAEIYNATSAALQAFTTSAQVQGVTIFSTFPKRVSGTFQTGETSGYSCPPGYALNTCNGAPVCSLIETIPFVPCPRTFLVTDCEGEETPFLTNTDLSSYIGGVYKTCIPPILYSNSCFVLKDCNRIVADIVTNTGLIGFLWQTVSLEGYPGSCFIVTGVPSGQICVGAIPVLINDVAPCVCPGAQQPWFPRCYCVTVEEVFPTLIAPDFEGVFVDIAYDCCLDCTRTCYLLTSCVGGINPVVVCNDLAQYVGLVIKIESCGDICWQVEIAGNCNNGISFAGNITAFEDCVNCLPPLPPVPPPYDLHLRKIKPGWKSPNRCYTLDYIERINCTFSQEVYNKMLISRYGITICCDDDQNKWDILKQLLDLDMLKDPDLCKSTLCCCPAPCLIDAVITLLPFCGAPLIISAVIDVPCPAPVLIGVDIDVEVIPAPCYCWKVDYTIAQPPLTLVYIDCCCITQTQVIDVSGEGSIAICSATAPVSFGADPIVVTNQGLCGEADLCNPPPPQECFCWKITNTSPRTGTYIVGEICPVTGFPLGIAGSIPPGPPGPATEAYFCSIQPPLVTDLNIYNMGPCDGYCGPTPPACVCYKIEVTNPAAGCAFYYTDCNGVPVTDFIPLTAISYVCALTVPAVSALSLCALIQPPAYTVSSTPFNCVNGVCGPPLPCDCYMVQISGNPVPPAQSTIYSFWNCNGVLETFGQYDGVYSCCAASPPFSISPYFSFYQTAQDCNLNECIEPYTTCICYEIVIAANSIPTTIHHVDCNGTPINEVFTNPIGGSPLLIRRCAQLSPTSPTVPPPIINFSGLNCALGQCVDPPAPVPCVCYSYQIVGGSGIVERQDYIDCTGSPAQIAGVDPQTGFICAQSISGIINPNILLSALTPGSPGCPPGC